MWFWVATLAGFLFGRLLGWSLRKLTGSEKIRYVAVAASAVTAAVITVHGISLYAVCRVLMGLALLFAAEYDYATHTVPDCVPVFILMTGLPGVELPLAISGLVLVPLPFLAAALIKEGSIGGGDIKLMGACGFALGLKRGYLALVSGLLLAVLFQAAYAEKKDRGFALVPYLAAGCLFAMLA